MDVVAAEVIGATRLNRRLTIIQDKQRQAAVQSRRESAPFLRKRDLSRPYPAQLDRTQITPGAAGHQAAFFWFSFLMVSFICSDPSFR